MPVERHRAKDAELRGLVRGVEREIRRLPIRPHAEALELRALPVDRLERKRAGALAQRERRERTPLSRALDALQDLELDGQAVAVPAGHEAHASALHHLEPVDEVLEDLVERVPAVQVAVRVRRPVVQREGLARVGVAEALVHTRVLPERLQLGLAHHRVRPLVKAGLRQRDRPRIDRLGAGLLRAAALLGGARDAAGARSTRARATHEPPPEGPRGPRCQTRRAVLQRGHDRDHR
mmetsp:Transcript_6581/g.20720  ORF Transcript_6581/g.20720 Transcript_6581/m.20720 type:complete len:236 (-) Transcript_6581:15-722(-)